MNSRRNFIKKAGVLAAGSALPLSVVELSHANAADNFTFAFISDSHIQQIKGNKFVQNWDRGLERAVAEANLMDPKPDFVMYGGDIAQIGTAAEIDHGLDILSALHAKTHFVMGEHDYYLDLGEHWSKRLGDQYYSFDHKGVHFVVLNSIVTTEEWTNKWSSGEERMGVMAGLDDPRGSPFMVGDVQRAWLENDLKDIDDSAPVIIFSHSPLQKLFANWNFWTDDAEQIHAILGRFDNVNVFYGHVHQIQYNQIGNIKFHSAMATAWPWPYPNSYAQATNYMPKLTVPMNRADPFFERDATGWQFIDIHSGKADIEYILPENDGRKLAYNKETRRPEDTQYQAKQKASQKHY